MHNVMSFSEVNAHTDPLIKKLKILKIEDNITLQKLVHAFLINYLNPLGILLIN